MLAARSVRPALERPLWQASCQACRIAELPELSEEEPKMTKMNPLSAFRTVALLVGVFISLVFFSAVTLADEECTDPIAQWQPREVLKTKLEQQGWVVKRIRIDDGCYEVRAIDAQGRRVKATYAPASLTLLELELKHDKHEHREH